MRRDATALRRFEEYTAWPMLILSLAILPLLILPLMFDLSPGLESTFFALDWMIWGLFALEYGIRLYLAPAKLQFVRRNLVDLAVVIIPLLRPLRVLQSARAIRLLRAARAAAFLLRGVDAGRQVLTRHKLHYALLVALFVVVGGGLLVGEFERSAPDGNIKSVPDALWWAITTVTTVGYGDRFPVTPQGRGVAVILMVAGIGIFGLLAASLASFFVEHQREEKEDPKLAEIVERLKRIEEALGADDRSARGFGIDERNGENGADLTQGKSSRDGTEL